MTPKKHSIRTLPEWARLILASKDQVIKNLRTQLDEQEAQFELYLRALERKEAR